LQRHNIRTLMNGLLQDLQPAPIQATP